MKRTRLSAMLLGISMMLYCVIGFTGFDPVRQDEAYIFGIILEYWRGQSWVVPLLGGIPYMEKPPLYYLLGAASAHAFSSWLPLHDAARLSSAVLIAITTSAMAASGRLLWGEGYGRFTALALLGSLGLIVPAHMMLTDNAELAGIAISLFGFAGASRNRPWAGLAIGTGAGVAFLSKGLLGPGIIGLSAVMLLLWPQWRRRSFAFTLLIALLAALPWLCVWPLALYRTSPALLADWLLQNNFGRFLGYAPDYLNAVKDTSFWYTTLWWATFPLLPLAVLSLRQFRADWQQLPGIQIGLAMTIALLGVLAASSTLRSIYALPLLLVLALIAVPILREPPSWISRVATGSSVLFISLALMIWALWIAFAFHFISPGSQTLWGIIPADLNLSVNMTAVLGALALSVFWFVCQKYWRAEAWCAGATWYSSLMSASALFALLWLPSIEKHGSYRPLFEQMANVLPIDTCVTSVGLGESQRGMLDYVLQVQTQPEINPLNSQCDSLLIDGSTNEKLPPLPAEWSLVWSGKRSSDAHEQFWLYTRNHPDLDATEVASQRRHDKHRMGITRMHQRRRA